ncbi:MAG TPA: LysR family transcriptional regulator [Polyangia bacterium]|jgi:LysR family transcriptional activator of nhaA
MVTSPRLPNFNHLYYFHIVASEGSLAKAASRLRVTQPTISTQIRQLEDSVGHRLFERSGRGMKLTAKGEYVVEHTSLMFRTSQRMIQGLQPKNAPEPRSLAIGVASSVANTMAARTFVPLLSSSVLLQIKHGDQDYLMRELLSRDIDIMIGDRAPVGGRERRLLVEEIARPQFVAIAPKALAQRVKMFPNDLARIPLVLYPPTSRYRWEIERYLTDHGVEPTVAGETEDVGIMLACVQAGACGAILPGVHIDAMRGRWRPVILGSPSIDAPVFAYHQKSDAGDLIRRTIETLKVAQVTKSGHR